MRCRQYEEVPLLGLCRALFCYAGPASLLMRAWKFGKHRVLARFIAHSFARELALLPKELLWRDLIIVPAPSSPGRLKRCAWDQMALVARELSSLTGLPLSSCLVRGHSQSQKTLDRQGREANLRGKIHCKRQPPRRALLIDDVVTTGATLRSCERALFDGGSLEVYCLVFCYD